MIFSVSLYRYSLPLLAAVVLLSGCLQPDGPQDEQKEPHFMDGKRCANSLDYKGAIEHFQKALEVNPRNASAHFELGVLFDQMEPDPAAAIYHYQSYLRLNPKGPQAELATSHIYACKQQLVRTVSLGPVTQTLQAEYEKVSEENKKLREQLEQWKALANRLQLALTNRAAVSSNPARSAGEPGAIPAARIPNPSPPTKTVSSSTHPASPAVTKQTPASVPAKRTHIVRQGETPAQIARKYGIRVEALLAANPSLNERRMRVGQSLSLP
jgi:tetratricopeptide (TPR) repeat protein